MFWKGAIVNFHASEDNPLRFEDCGYDLEMAIAHHQVFNECLL